MKRQRRKFEDVTAPRVKDLNILKKMNTIGPTGKMLETAPTTIQDLPAKLNPNKETLLLTNRLTKRASSCQSWSSVNKQEISHRDPILNKEIGDIAEQRIYF